MGVVLRFDLRFDLRKVLDLAEQAITTTGPAGAAGPALCWVTGAGTYLTADPAHHTRVYATGHGPGTPWLDAVLAGIDTPAVQSMPLHAPAGRPLIGLLRAAAAAGHAELLIHQAPGRFTSPSRGATEPPPHATTGHRHEHQTT